MNNKKESGSKDALLLSSGLYTTTVRIRRPCENVNITSDTQMLQMSFCCCRQTTSPVSVYAITPLTDGSQGVMPLFPFPVLFNSLFTPTIVKSLLIL